MGFIPSAVGVDCGMDNVDYPVKLDFRGGGVMERVGDEANRFIKKYLW